MGSQKVLPDVEVSLPMGIKAHLLTSGCGEGKCSVYCQTLSKEAKQLALKRLQLPSSFQDNVLKHRVRESVAAVWLAHGQSSGWLVVSNQEGKWHYQPPGYNLSEFYMLVGHIQ